MKKPLCFALLSGILGLFFLFPAGGDPWQRQLDKFDTIYHLIRSEYVGDFSPQKAIHAAIGGLLQSLDPHSYFLDPLTLRSMVEEQRGKYFGIGIRIVKYEDRIIVHSPLKDTPAFRLGVAAGDVIEEIDGKSTRDMSLDQAMKRLRGKRGSQVRIKVSRPGVEGLLTFKIERQEIPLNTISYALPHPLDPSTGYISVRAFGGTTPEELRQNIDRLMGRRRIRRLILDLRGNTGGSFNAAIQVADLFLETGKTIVSTRGRNESECYAARRDDQFEDLPLVVLIDRQSASASEIVAAAMQDHERATIIGTRSWGKGLVETLLPLSLGSALALTTAKYYTPANRSLQRDYLSQDAYWAVLRNDAYDTDLQMRGGVVPDILVRSEVYPPFVLGLVSRGFFFEFSLRLIESNERITPQFKANTAIIQAFQDFLRQRKLSFEDRDFLEHSDAIRHEIERDVLFHRFSAETAIVVFLRTDPVIARALEVLQAKGNKESK